jgi:ABC-type lipoprotein export system ATPase subunit
MSSTLVLSKVEKTFFGHNQKCLVFKDLSYEFRQGQSYAITGVSGTGKSTLLSLLAGIETATSGSILLDSNDVSVLAAKTPRTFFHEKVSIIFQSAHLLPELTVIENVIIKGLLKGLSFATSIRKGKQLLEKVNLENKAQEYPSTLSGGEQQRVAVLRALFLEPDFLLADEPTAHLDPVHKELIMSLLEEYRNQLSMGLIVSTHDREVAYRMNRVLELKEGSLIEHKSLERRA